MDFTLHDEQEALLQLARKILTDLSTQERLDALDAADQWLDRELLRELAGAGILGIAVPEEYGGGGRGFLELHLILAEVGATVAHVPLWETAVLGGLPVAAFGSEDQRMRFLPGVAAGEVILTAALAEEGRGDPTVLVTTARSQAGGWRLDGTRTRVPCAPLADGILVPAGTDAGEVGVFLVDPGSEGVDVRAQETISGRPHAEVRLTDVFVPDSDVLGDVGEGPHLLTWLLEHAEAGLASMQAGVTRTALEMSASYTAEREQFGRRIGSFQAVGQRVADAFIDAEGVRLTSLQAAWRLAEGLPATDAVAIAKWWAAEGAHRVVHAAQHVHGGIGIDFEYPLHRYFTMAKEIEFTLGHGTDQLLRLGRRMATEPV